MTKSQSRPHAAAPPSNPAADRAALALWLTLAALTAARAALSFVPSMWGWGLDLLRFIAPAPGWTLWAVAALALVPALARRALPALEALGRALDSSAALAYGAWGAGAAALAWAFPDRLRFVGDFLLRFGTAERAYQRLLEKQPDNDLGWLGLMAVSMRLRDVPEAKRAATELRRRQPANTEVQRALVEIARYEVLQADSARRAVER